MKRYKASSCLATNKGVQGLCLVKECVWLDSKLGLGHTGEGTPHRRGGLTKEGVPADACCDLCNRRIDNVETQINTMFGRGGAGGPVPVRGPGPTKPFIPGQCY